MDNIIVQLSIFDAMFDPLYKLFGWLVREFYVFFGNYGLAIIALTILIRGLLIPLNIKSQKSMLKMQALSGKTAELQRKYGNDKQRYQQEVMKLQQENGAMGCSGCILPFLQLFIIIPIYRIISGPLLYISGVSGSNINKMIKFAKESGLSVAGISKVNHIGLIKLLNNNSTFLQKSVSDGNIKMSQLLDLHFMGLDLSKTPWEVLKNVKGISTDTGNYIAFMMFPVLVLVIQLISMKLTNWLKPGYKEEQEKKKRAKDNPALSDQVQDDAAATSMKLMIWIMPFIMLFTTFSLPAAMGLYWIVGGLMGLLTQYLVFVLFTKPYELKKAEIEAKKVAVFKKNKNAESDSESKKNGKNQKNKNKSKK